MDHQTHDIDVGRRRALKTLALAATAGGLATATTGPVTAQESGLEAWFDGVANYDGVVDVTGADTVTVAVGADNGGNAVGFGPAAVRVDPGTTVVWEWTGEGGYHNVVATDGAFESDLTQDAGATFEHTFDSEGVTRYVCTPHEPLGMKGAVVVGAPAGASTGGSTVTELAYGEWFADTSNYDGTTVDARGQDAVSIDVGAPGNGGDLAFEPAAVWVDPGTEVTWEWTGDGGQHNVYDEDTGFESPLQGEAGATYTLEFDGEGVVTYACAPHEAAGMKGAVVVGSQRQATGAAWTGPLKGVLVGMAGAIVAAPYVIAYLLGRRRRDDSALPSSSLDRGQVR